MLFRSKAGGGHTGRALITIHVGNIWQVWATYCRMVGDNDLALWPRWNTRLTNVGVVYSVFIVTQGCFFFFTPVSTLLSR